MPKFKIQYIDKYEIILEAKTEVEAIAMMDDEEMLKSKIFLDSDVLEVKEIK